MPPRRRGVTGAPAGPLRAPLDYALGARSRVAVLRVLTAEPSAMSQRELARRAGVQVRSGQQAVDALVTLGIAERTVGGRDHLVRFNSAHILAPSLRALFAAEADRFRRLREALRTWAAAPARARSIAGVAVVGSGARGDDAPGSDLDVVVVTVDVEAAVRLTDEFTEIAAALRVEHGVEARALVVARSQLRTGVARRRAPFPALLRDALTVSGAGLRELAT